MKTISLVGSVSRRAGGLFESVRRLHQELHGDAQKGPQENLARKSAPEIEVRVLGLQDEFAEQDRQAWDPVPVDVLRVAGPRAFGYAPRLRRMLDEGSPELIHVHGLWQYSSLAALEWHSKSGKPYIVSAHGMLDSWALKNSAWKKRVAWLLYERRHLQGAACIRALCRSELSSIRKLGLRNPVCLVPNGIDVSSETRDAPDAKPPAEGPSLLHHNRLLLYLGRIHPKKGLPSLLEAWSRIGRSSGWSLIVAGWDQGGHEAQLKRLAADLGILSNFADGSAPVMGRVSFIGPQFGEAKRRLLRQCQALVLPSLSEGVPMTVLEAWANAKPVLMTPQCNLPEGASAGAGILVNPDSASIVSGLRTLFLASDATRECLGYRGRRLVQEKFSWPRIVSDLQAVYLWLGKQGPKPECVVN